MQVRKITYLFVAAALLVAAFALTGCGTKEESTGTTAAATTSTAPAADGSLAKVKTAGTLVVGMAPFYAPFESTNEKTKVIEGFDVDLMNAITAKMGLKAEFKSAEWEALLGGLAKGDYDVIFSAMSKKEAAAGNVSFSEAYYQLPDVIIVAKGNPKGINSQADLKGKIVGVQLASGDEQIADKLKATDGFSDVKKYKLTQDAMNDLKVGRIDAVFAGLAFAVEQSKVDPSFLVVGQPLETSDLVGVFPKGATSLTDAFNAALAEVKADGTYDKLLTKWLTVKK